MYKYFSDSWEYQPRADLEEFGIICMKNTVTNTYEFLQLVTESGSLNYSKDPNSNILDLIITDKNALEKYRESSNLLRPSIGNIYLMRAAIALAQLNGAYKEVTSIDNIKVLSVINGTQANITLDVDKLHNTLHILQ